MGRLVTAIQTFDGKNRRPKAPKEELKDHLDRISKYIPAEIIALYISLNAAFETLPFSNNVYWYNSNLLVCWAITPLYFKWVSRPSESMSVRTQQKVSAIAFIIWAYAFSGPAGFFKIGNENLYYPGIALALLSIFTFISGFITPTTSATDGNAA